MLINSIKRLLRQSLWMYDHQNIDVFFDYLGVGFYAAQIIKLANIIGNHPLLCCLTRHRIETTVDIKRGE